MIEGLRLKVPTRELAEHCTKRAVYHRNRAEEKQAELPRLKEAMDRIKSQTFALPQSTSGMNKGGYALDPDDPVDRLERDIKDHRNKALVFDFFAGHLFDEDYNLKEDDLVRLEILKR